MLFSPFVKVFLLQYIVPNFSRFGKPLEASAWNFPPYDSTIPYRIYVFMTYLLAISSFVSRLLGIIRNNRFADLFGATDLSDAYFAAFQIPDLIYSIIVYGALSAAFVPLFVEHIHTAKTSGGQKTLWDFTSSVLSLLVCFIALCAIVLFFASPYLIPVLYPGFDPETQQVTVNLMRIMLLSPIFFGFSSVFSGIQTAFGNFLFYSLAPVIYNLSIIFGIVYLAPIYGIYGVAYGVVIGAFLHALIQVPAMIRVGFRLSPSFSWFRSDIRKLISLSIPRVLGLALLQANYLVEGFIASLGLVGGLSVLRYAQDLQSFPVGIVGLSVAVGSFSVLSSLALKNDDLKMFFDTLSRKIDNVLFLIIPSSVGLFLLREPIVRLILHSGAFTERDSFVTANTLGILCVSLFAASLIPLLSRAFYAVKDTKSPLFFSIAAIAVNATLGLLLTPHYGVYGLAMANAISSILNIALLLLSLRIRVPKARFAFPISSFLKTLFASAVMGAAVYLLQRIVSLPSSFMALLGLTLIFAGAGAAVYFGISFLVKAPALAGGIRSLVNGFKRQAD